MTHPSDEVAREVEAVAVPIRVNVLENRPLCKKMKAVWTPIFAFLDGEGEEHHRFIGFLPPEEFIPQAHLAKARERFAKADYESARAAYQSVVDRWPASDAAPESLYWTGVCDFKLKKSMDLLLDRCREVAKRYPAHIWGKKLAFIK